PCASTSVSWLLPVCFPVNRELRLQTARLNLASPPSHTSPIRLVATTAWQVPGPRREWVPCSPSPGGEGWGEGEHNLTRPKNLAIVFSFLPDSHPGPRRRAN